MSNFTLHDALGWSVIALVAGFSIACYEANRPKQHECVIKVHNELMVTIVRLVPCEER